VKEWMASFYEFVSADSDVGCTVRGLHGDRGCFDHQRHPFWV
jgi:hypothetical protein